MTAIALTIAGSDSGGGAGIQADLKTFSALGVYGTSVITALTAQNTMGVTGIKDVEPDFITAQMDAVFSDIAVNAVKIGMLSRIHTIEAVADGLDRHQVQKTVFDPVMVATSGDRLIDDQAVNHLKSLLFPRALLITPNLHEAAVITGGPVATSETEMRQQGDAMLNMGAQAVLMKGGHGEGHDCTDLLITHDQVLPFTSPRIETQNTHGTGCSLSSAIAAHLAHGLPLHEAVARAKTYISAAIKAADQLKIGHGHGPIHHFHAVWR
jgi:hydroxymethylpyrimidine/phosphomethylpyrimidine kinase